MNDHIKVGDVVIITGCFYGHGFKIGAKVRILEVIIEPNYVAYDAGRINNHNDKWRIEDDEIETQE